MAHPALNIACYFVNRSLSEIEPISNMKLQKMVYIANGIYLAYKGKGLIRENIEAWTYGPVVEPVYHFFKSFGNGDILRRIPDCELFHRSQFNEDEISALDFTWDFCKKWDAIRLSNWSHTEGSPWYRAKRENLSSIPNKYIEDYFKIFLKNNG